MDEKMADEAPSHIWKKFLPLFASTGHSAVAGGLIWYFKAKARVRTERISVLCIHRSSEMHCKV